MTQDINDVLKPLNEEQLQGLRDSLGGIKIVRKAIIKARSAGIDTTDLEADTDHNESRLKKILTVYDPSFRG
ncbi:hypothetical protein LCGC14_1140230 [marine sediment metagenome]|uniref:Uncharacterized protein n=1 Tax=marine sediment metagenome TaxID=412755 RepID=A0A0F9MLJ3_9ZZZZ